jgi:hypothetical protein
VVYLVAQYWKTLPLPKLSVLSVAITLFSLVATAAYPCWWGGYSYGARLMMDALPWFVLLAIMGCAAASVGRNSILSSSERGVLLVLLMLSIAINGRGAFSVSTQQWSTVVDVDRHPEHIFDWSYPQFAAGLIPPPHYVLENINRLRRAAAASNRD